jgi:Zn-finger protein
MSKNSLYSECVEAGLELDHHESDLYIKDCPKARELLDSRKIKFETFRCRFDGAVWLDAPFCYIPFWEALDKRDARKNDSGNYSNEGF